MPSWYNRDGEPIDTNTANRLLADLDYKRVALTHIASKSDPTVRHRVSTVWLGLDHNLDGGTPILFETMVFGDDDSFVDQWMRRYFTEVEAKAGHEEIVAVVAATVPDEVVTAYDPWALEA